MALDKFLGRVDGSQRRLVVADRTAPEPIQRMLEDLFEGQGVPVEEQNTSIEERVEGDHEEDTVLLVEDGEVVATSPLGALRDAILMVNSDLYVTGTRSLESTAVPAVIDGLTETPFSLRGYPASNKEKLLLILISRHIERLAYEHGEGRLRSSFQYLSRIEDERGTRNAYERIAETGVDVHVYGQPNWAPSPDFPVTIHGGYKWDFRNSWFVLYESPEEDQQAALLAIETDDAEWEGFWTYESSLVDEVAAYIRRVL